MVLFYVCPRQACCFISRADFLHCPVTSVSLGKKSILSRLDQIVRQNEVVWRTLYEVKATFPPERGSNSSKGKAPKVGIRSYTSLLAAVNRSLRLLPADKPAAHLTI